MKAHSSIRRHAITGKSRLRQRWVMTHSNRGTETAKPAFAIQCSAAIFMRERHNQRGGRARSGAALWLERMDEIKFAIFEASGRISIIPKRNTVAGEDGSAPRGD
jgi:hypothetical protein